MDTPKKPQTSDEEEVPAPPAPVPSPALPARSPFRPVSRRRRQAQLPEPPSADERPGTNMIFDASPTTIAAALAKAGAPSAESSLAWRPGDDSNVEVDVDVEIELGEARGVGGVPPTEAAGAANEDEAGTASPR